MLHYTNAVTSVLKLCKDFADEHNLTVHDFDAHATLAELPKVDLIGPMELEVENDEGLLSVMGMIGVSLVEDLNLFRTRPLMGQLFQTLAPNRVFKLYNAETAVCYGMMKIRNGTHVMPVVRTKHRPVQFVAFSAATDQRMLSQ